MLHMLRGVLGDEAFSRGIRAYYAEFPTGTRRPRISVERWKKRPAATSPDSSGSGSIAEASRESRVDLGRVLHALYDRASYDLRVDYSREPVPPLSASDPEWESRLHSGR